VREKLDDFDVEVDIQKITGGEPRYDAFSVTAKARIVDEEVDSFERTIALNVLKKQGNFDMGESGVPKIVERIKEKYATMLEEENAFGGFSSQELSEEKSKVEECRGRCFEV